MQYFLQYNYDLNISEVYSKFNLLSDVASLCNNGRTKDARQIERRQIFAIREINATDNSHFSTFYLQVIMIYLQIKAEYSEVIELAECAFKFYKDINHTTSIILLFIASDSIL